MQNYFANFQYRVAQYFARKYNTAQSFGVIGQRNGPLPLQWNSWDVQRATCKGFRSNTYVYACIRKWMLSVSVVPLKVYVKNAEGLWEEAPMHPLQKLLDNPNPYIDLPRMVRIMTAHMQLTGNGLWSKVRDAKKLPTELWPINPDSIRPVPSEDDYISHYQPVWRTTPKRIEVEDIVHFQLEDPACPFWGVGPLQAAARAVDTDNASVDWNKTAMDNRAVPDGVLSFKGPIAKDQYEIARERLKERLGKKNARDFLIMNQEVSWQSLGLTPIEMDFTNSRKFTREEMASVFGVPPILVGISDNAPLSNENIKAASRMFWKDMVLPFLDSIRATLNLQLTTEFGDPQTLTIDYDITGVEALQDDITAKVTAAQGLWAMGVPFNELNDRLELGFDPIEGGDTGYISPNLWPVNAAEQAVARILNQPDAANPQASGEEGAVTEEESPSGDSDAEQVQASNAVTMYTKSALKNLVDIGRAMRVEEWKVLERQREPFDIWGARLFAAALTNEGNDAANTYLRSNGNEAETLDTVDGKVWEKDLPTFYKKVISDFGERTNERFEKSLKKKAGYSHKAFDITSAAIVAWIEATAAKRATLIAETSKEEVARVIRQGVLAGLSVDKIAMAIRVFYTERKAARAMLIARTEVVAASNYGSWQGAKQTSVPMIRTWLATSDDRTREAHADADGQTTGMEGTFNVDGQSLSYPGDPVGSADNVINCRCGVQYNVDPSFLED